MILFDKKIIYIHIPRCAGTSIKESLKAISKNNSDKPWHLPLLEHKEKYNIILNNYFIFSIVRHPYDRMLSIYNHKKYVRNWADVRDRDFDEWIKFLSVQKKEDFIGLLSYTEWLKGDFPKYIFKYEELNLRYRVLKKIFGLPELKHLHNLKKYKNEIKDETKEIIYNLFKCDFIKYNYER